MSSPAQGYVAGSGLRGSSGKSSSVDGSARTWGGRCAENDTQFLVIIFHSVDKTISPPGQFSGYSGAFNHITQPSSAGDEVRKFNFNSNVITNERKTDVLIHADISERISPVCLLSKNRTKNVEIK